MPELPEVETIARTLGAEATGREILRVEVRDPVALFPDPAGFQALVTGRRIESVGRRAKLLLLDLSPLGGDGGARIAVHLRMTGRVFVLAPGMETDRTRAVLHLSGGQRLAFADLRRFGSMHAFPVGGSADIASWPFYASLGPEPLTMAADEFRARLGQGRARVKALLLDQSVVAGIGNIYADEALFRAGIRPDTSAGQIPPDKRDALFTAIQAVLTQAIAENGSSIRDYRDAHGHAGAFQNHFRAYGRGGQACLACGETMCVMRVAGRTSTYCPRCQPAPKN
ncbi:MAG: bifunctional DNA-formamidopyrimidine glycosylase/DNA-(apurinic or apyrimidinic site) lyase [Humidesulfovibrio sp.]|nr:bifunctional DNA-formamidopyrimidine glycosylase/DNA-(apurinic or apyrimidinic site) lyase [Humidesulfovibrio sp.]